MASVMLALQQAGSPADYVVEWTTVWAWIGFGFFFAGLVGFAAMGTRATEQSIGHFVTKFFVVFAAMASYLVLALNQGAQTSGETTEFAYARFIDWSITTPLLLLGLALLALPRAREALPLVLGLMATDAFMILTGLFSGLSNENGGAWWVWYIPSAIAQVVIYALLWGPLAKKAKDQGQEGRQMLKSQDPQERYQGVIHVGQSGWYVAMAALLSVIWVAYPINFFLSEQGLGVWGLNASSAIYTVADIIAKPIYGFILLGGVLAIERRAEKARNEPPERYDTDVERAQREAEEARREARAARRELEAVRAGDRRTRTTAEIEGPGQQPAARERYYDVEERYEVEEDTDPGADPVRVRRTPRA